MAFDLGGALNNVLDAGLDIWVDSEKARNYRPGAQTLGQRDAGGITGVAGQPAANVASPSMQAAAAADWSKNPVVWAAVGVVVLLLVVVVVKD